PRGNLCSKTERRPLCTPSSRPVWAADRTIHPDNNLSSLSCRPRDNKSGRPSDPLSLLFLTEPCQQATGQSLRWKELAPVLRQVAHLDNPARPARCQKALLAYSFSVAERGSSAASGAWVPLPHNNRNAPDVRSSTLFAGDPRSLPAPFSPS